jgi:hypothetical protein
MSMKNSNDTIGNRTRDLPACSAATVIYDMKNSAVSESVFTDTSSCENKQV